MQLILLSLFSATLFIVTSTLANAQSFRSSLSADDLLRQCEFAANRTQEDDELPQQEIASAAFCAGYIQAAADAGSLLGALPNSANAPDSSVMESGIRNCAAADVEGLDLLKIVVHFIQAEPASRRLGAASIVMLALARAFPCPSIQAGH